MSNSTARRGARLRTILFSSAALASLAIAGNAHAQVAPADGSDAPTNAYLGPQDKSVGGDAVTGAYLAPQGDATTSTAPADEGKPVLVPVTGPQIVKVDPEPNIVIANPGTTTSDRDPNVVTGIGQMIVDQGGGFIGLCTATLINPRVVIFAAHCVNTAAATSYGANSGGTGIGFGFENNTRANVPGAPDELVQWLLGGNGGPGQFKTNVGSSFFNSNWVNYNPGSLEPAAQGFLYSDIAMASLDTPAAGIPTWALLFSPLPAQGGGAAGTGYNVGMVGYGGIGTGQQGQTANSDFRRRQADNIIGALTDLKTFETFLFGSAQASPNTQNLYMMDFDDPRRFSGGASPFDFNAFRDNARNNEGITAPGDSGGPLLLQTFAKQVVIGTLSGGYARFFNGQTSYSYGAVSFYQPLYLYWDWIAANNPYHYVGAVAGNGSWTDPNHWVTTLDPAYMILNNGQLTNGLPSSPGEGKNGTSGDFGQICFQSGGVSDCYNTATGIETVDARPIGTATDQPDTSNVAATGALTGDLDPVREAQDGSQTTFALPPATLANGLPGATNFVPNNADPVRTAGTAPKYFDVTLANTGITTLTGANITIDRLTIGTAGAQLVIDSGASLTTLINTTQFAGQTTVNGTLTSVGDVSILGGALLGSGRINAPYLTSVLAQIAPGTTSTIGTLTIGGNLVMSSGTGTFINLGPNGTSDKIAVVANLLNGNTPIDGLATLGGTVTFSTVGGYNYTAGDVFTILTAQNARTGTFSTSAVSAILTPTFIYSQFDVKVQIVAGTYASVINTGSPVQVSYAKLLDGDRAGSQSALSALYGPLDLQNQATIRATLDSWAPRGETLKTALGVALNDNMARFWRDRLDSVGSGDTGGTIAIIGQPLSVLANVNNVGPTNNVMEPGAGAGSQPTSMTKGQVPDDMAVFFAGGYLNGSAAPMPTAVPFGGRSSFDGWYAAAGVEKKASSVLSIGFGLSYSHIDGNTTAGDNGRGELYQGTLYMKAAWPNGFTIDGVASAGLFDINNTRIASLVGTNYTLRSDDQSLALSGELGMGKTWDVGGLKVGPRAALRYSQLGFSTTVESGGPMALKIERKTYDSLQGRVGLTLGGSKGQVRPYLTGYYVHDFNDTPASFGANFVGGSGPSAVFALGGTDKDWWEVSGGLALDLKNVELTVGADTTIGRDDVRNQSYRAGIKFRF